MLGKRTGGPADTGTARRHYPQQHPKPQRDDAQVYGGAGLRAELERKERRRECAIAEDVGALRRELRDEQRLQSDPYLSRWDDRPNHVNRDDYLRLARVVVELAAKAGLR